MADNQTPSDDDATTMPSSFPKVGQKKTYVIQAFGSDGVEIPPRQTITFFASRFDTRSTATPNGQWARFHLSYSQIHAAIFHMNQSLGIEAVADWSENSLMNHRACVMSAVSSSVSYLEALINEIYIDAGSSVLSVSGLPEEVKKSLRIVWGLEIFQRNVSIFDKFRYALQYAGAQSFDKGKSPYQDVVALIDLRNVLTHHKPQEYQILASPDADPKQETSKKQLAYVAQKFPNHPARITQGVCLGSALENCLYGECARWAVESSLEFANEFLEMMGIPKLKVRNVS